MISVSSWLVIPYKNWFLFKMYSTFTHQLFSILAKWTRKVGAHSAYFNEKGVNFYCTQKSRRKFVTCNILYVIFRFCIWIPTLKLWRYCGGMGNNQFYSAYGILCATVLIIWLLFNFYPLQDDFYVVINWILCYFPRFMGKIFSHKF